MTPHPGTAQHTAVLHHTVVCDALLGCLKSLTSARVTAQRSPTVISSVAAANQRNASFAGLRTLRLSGNASRFASFKLMAANANAAANPNRPFSPSTIPTATAKSTATPDCAGTGFTNGSLSGGSQRRDSDSYVSTATARADNLVFARTNALRLLRFVVNALSRDLASVRFSIRAAIAKATGGTP